MQRPNNPNEAPLLGADRALTGLSLRAFRLWISCHVALDRDDYVVPLIGEVRRNATVRLIRTLVAAAQRHPRNEILKQGLIGLLDSDDGLLPHCVAEIIRALRYMSVLEDRLVVQCYERLHDRSARFYLRAQCAYLLNRVPLSAEQLDRCARAFENEPNPQVKVALAGLHVQQAPNLNVIRRLVAHPSEEVQQFGALLQAIAYDRRAAGRKLVYILSPPMDRRLVDSMPLVYAMSQSPDDQIQAMLRDASDYMANNTLLDGLRHVLVRLRCRGAGAELSRPVEAAQSSVATAELGLAVR